MRLTIMYVLVPSNNHQITRSLILPILLESFLILGVKNLIPTWFVYLKLPGGVVNGWGLHIDGVVQSFCDLLIPNLNIPPGAGFALLLILIILFSVYLIQFHYKWADNSAFIIVKPLLASNFLWYSCFCIIFSLLAVSFFARIAAIRYLVIIPILLYSSIAILYASLERNNRVIPSVIIIFMIFSLIVSFQMISTMPVPNTDENNLIQYISQNKLSPAYADFWDANIMTYLSNEKVVIRPLKFENGEISPFLYLSSRNWFPRNLSEKKPFVLITRNIEGFGSGNLTHIPDYYPPDNCHYLGPYRISIYNKTAFLPLKQGEYSEVNYIYQLLKTNF